MESSFDCDILDGDVFHIVRQPSLTSAFTLPRLPSGLRRWSNFCVCEDEMVVMVVVVVVVVVLLVLFAT
jgi:hypothetical protein